MSTESLQQPPPEPQYWLPDRDDPSSDIMAAITEQTLLLLPFAAELEYRRQSDVRYEEVARETKGSVETLMYWGSRGSSRAVHYRIPYQTQSGKIEGHIAIQETGRTAPWQLTLVNLGGNPLQFLTGMQSSTVIDPGLERLCSLGEYVTNADRVPSKEGRHVFKLPVPRAYTEDIWNTVQDNLDGKGVPVAFGCRHIFAPDDGPRVSIVAKNQLIDSDEYPNRTPSQLTVTEEGVFRFTHQAMPGGSSKRSFAPLEPMNGPQPLTEEDRLRHPYRVESVTRDDKVQGFRIIRRISEGWIPIASFVPTSEEAWDTADRYYSQNLHDERRSSRVTPERAQRVVELLKRVYDYEVRQLASG